jgi:hypothetical protein
VRSATCTWRRGTRVSWLSLKTKVNSLSVLCPQNYWDGFLRFGLKTSDDGFLRFGLETGGNDFSLFGLKTSGGFLVEPQNQCGGGFHGLGLKTGSYGLMICASKSL